MASVGVRELKAGLSRYLRRVARGERITVTVRGQPVAELLPVGRRPENDKLRRLAADGKVTLPTKKMSRRAPTPQKTATRASDYILAEREAER